MATEDITVYKFITLGHSVSLIVGSENLVLIYRVNLFYVNSKGQSRQFSVFISFFFPVETRKRVKPIF